MSDTIIIKPGSWVLLNRDVKARVTAVSLRLGSNEETLCTSYQCVWWRGSERVELWVESFEVAALDTASVVPVGFANGVRKEAQHAH